MIDNVVDPEARDRDDCVNDAYTEYSLIFYRADNPPDADTTVLCTNGEEVFLGYYEGFDEESQTHLWFDQHNGHPAKVRAWAELPDPNECLADCYPDRACRVCGCTQDHGCPEGCSWVEWDLCSACVGKEPECQQK
jgi:hypothetical protein